MKRKYFKLTKNYKLLKDSGNITKDGFRGEFFYLSNFYKCPIKITYKGQDFLFKSGEHVFQGMKVAAFKDQTITLPKLRELELIETPAKAKYWGRSVVIDSVKWDSMALSAMKRVIDLKFSQNNDLLEKLLKSDPIELVEFNSWGDKLWGVDENILEGENRLGRLLMYFRAVEKRRLAEDI